MRLPTSRWAARRVGGDRGSAALFVAISAVALLAMAGLVIDGGYALADRQTAADAAEQAARAGADALSQNSLRSDGPARVNPAKARAAAERLLTQLDLAGEVSVDGATVTVTVHIVRHTTILSAVGVDQLTLTGTASARSVPGLVSQTGEP